MTQLTLIHVAVGLNQPTRHTARRLLGRFAFWNNKRSSGRQRGAKMFTRNGSVVTETNNTKGDMLDVVNGSSARVLVVLSGKG